MPFEASFYSSLIRDYTSQVFTYHNHIQYEALTIAQKVRYLFNAAVLDSRKTYKYNGTHVSKYINGIADTREKKMFSKYIDILDGNYQKLNSLEDKV